MEKELTRCRRRWSVVAMQLGSLRLPAGGGGEEQERSGEHRTTQAAESRRSRPGGGGGMNGKDPVRAFVCRRRFLATQATAELRASLLSLSPHLMGWDRDEEEQKEVASGGWGPPAGHEKRAWSNLPREATAAEISYVSKRDPASTTCQTRLDHATTALPPWVGILQALFSL
jgi:hypothetical protein